MRLHVSLRIIGVFLGAAGVCLPLAALPQSQDAQSQQSGSQDSSVADAARRTREKKKNPDNVSKSPKVITDEDLDKHNFQPGQEGLNVGSTPKAETQAPSAQAVAAAEASDRAAEQPRKQAGGDPEIAKLKLQVEQAEKDLDLVRRQSALDQDTYFANPDYAHDRTGKVKIDREKQEISDKQQDVERLKAQLSALEESKGLSKSSARQNR
jgi:hypothetical protein